jgi:hypothetical protein
MWIEAKLQHATPRYFDDSRNSKNDSAFGARREMLALHGAMQRASMGVPESQSN